MKVCRKSLLFLLCLAQAFTAYLVSGAEKNIADMEAIYKLRRERQENYTALQKQYINMENKLLLELHTAQEKFRDDNTYFSPLHVAILSVGAWNINKSDEILLNLIDYQIDQSSLPAGIRVSGDFFYPAIRVLVKLRVDNEKVINTIANAKTDKQIHLLTWVLNERQGDDFAKTKAILDVALNSDKNIKEKENFSKAIDLLKNKKNSSDLIPSFADKLEM